MIFLPECGNIPENLCLPLPILGKDDGKPTPLAAIRTDVERFF